MIKKIFLSLALVSSMFAINDFDMSYYYKYKHINIFPENGATSVDENPQDWVAIYKQGDSNDWDNVLLWDRVKDLETYTYVRNEVREYGKVFRFNGLKEGDYEVRYFLNNSYDVYKSINFTLEGEEHKATLSIENQTDIALTVSPTHIGEDTWIGIYKVGDLNDWDNVKEWSWAYRDQITFDISNLEEGMYEARLFYNNSYDLEAKVNFTKAEGAETNIEIVNKTTSSITFSSTFQGEQEWNTWIGIYKKDDSNDWKNVKEWSWITQHENIFDIGGLEEGRYEARLFYNNSYDIEAQVEFEVLVGNDQVKRVDYYVDPDPIYYQGREIGHHIGLFADILSNYKYGASYRERYKKMLSPAKLVLTTIDILNADNEAQISKLNMPEGYKLLEMLTTNDYLYTVNTYRGVYAPAPTQSTIYIIDITNKENPALGGHINISDGSISNVTIEKEDNVFSVNFDDEDGNKVTKEFDVSDSDNPSIL